MAGVIGVLRKVFSSRAEIRAIVCENWWLQDTRLNVVTFILLMVFVECGSGLGFVGSRGSGF